MFALELWEDVSTSIPLASNPVLLILGSIILEVV